ncbi:maltose-6'-phosphate glucosidase [Lentibacillus halodurans]|uniref:Maltose-6'-phosphate glucosidase n=1 Tax=Lentibacillus halodurans TaxID=237679 RepID=A0A1I0XJP3_9BACI|nr:6-phospho-alpha-glucosidase [Lentibacillus halodurans]SFB00448.1 maltose-6'-phosphate glucosidase [Lentibacillus halodurans]
MQRKNLVIVGGGSTYTLGMIMSLIEEKEHFPLKKITFYDINATRQEIIAKAAKVLLKEHYPELESFSYTTDKATAFSDMDAAFVQIRTGGLAMRELDEQIPIQHGVIGQETCGAGGMAYGLRSIKDMIELVHDIRQYSRDAWILNYTNPAAIVGLALKREFPEDKRILNICDMPIAIMKSYADLLEKDVWELVPEYFGLNHFGWFSKILDKQGHDLTDDIKNKIINGDFLPTDKEIAHDESWIQTFRKARQMLVDFPEFLPNTYLQYYLYPDDLAKKESPDNTRARQVINGREKRVHELCDHIISQQTTHDINIEADIHGVYMIRAAASLVFNWKETFVVMVENNGIISNLPDDALVEVPALLTSHGPKAFSVGEIPTFYKGLIESQHAYEKLVVEAYYENSYNKLLQALTLNRTIVHAPKAKGILDDLIDTNKDYWPELN